jgi:hypothetical protein
MKGFKALLILFLLFLLSSQTAFGQYSISGDIDLSGGSYGVSGATMRLRIAGDHTVLTPTVVSNSIGNYTFTGLANGDYTIQPAIYGYEYTPGVTVVTIAGADVTGIDFLVQTNQPGNRIYGTVTGPGAVGATITLGTDPQETTETDSEGYYIFLDVPNGSYTLIPSLAGFTFTSDNPSYTAIVDDYDRHMPNFTSVSGETSTCTGNFVIDWNDTSGDIAALSGCTEIDGYLYIESTDLTSLTGLEGLTSVSGTVDIYNNPQLTSLNALNNLTSVDALRIRDNNVLTSLSGLNNITSVRNLEISRNNVLTSLNGLEGITSVSNYILISWNDVLTNLCALNNVILSGNELHIYENLLLSMATANALETQLRSNGFSGTNVNIHSNDGLELVTCDGCADGDADSVCDDEDNCPNNANPNQEDADGDTMGDVCDSDTIYGTISGDIQEDVTVYLYILNCGATQPHATAITDVQGYYSAGDLPIGRYAIYIAEPGYSFAPKGYWADIPNEPGQSYDSTATADLQ